VTTVRPAHDDGSATVEFVLLAVVLLVPFVYAVLCVFEVERAAYGLAAATREAGRAFVTAPDGAAAQERARAASALVLDDHGVVDPAPLRITCDASPCLTPGARVVVQVSMSVRLPLIPHLGTREPASVRVSATHVEVVDAFREARP